MTNKKKPAAPKGFKGFKFKIYWIYGIIAVLFLAINLPSSLSNSKNINETEFLKKVENKEVKKVTPLMKQYNKIKEKYPDALLLFMSNISEEYF